MGMECEEECVLEGPGMGYRDLRNILPLHTAQWSSAPGRPGRTGRTERPDSQNSASRY